MTNNKTKPNKPQVDEKTIEQFLMGFNPMDGIRSVEAFTGGNDAYIFRKTTNGLEVSKDYFTPFLWATEMPKELFFIGGIIQVAESDYDGQYVLHNGEAVLVDGENAIYIESYESSKDGKKRHVLWIRFRNEQTKEEYFEARKKEYKIDVEELTTSFTNEKIARMEKGYKFIYSIKKNAKFGKDGRGRKCDNPLLKKVLKNSTATLADFFREGGLSIRGTKYLDIFALRRACKHLSRTMLFELAQILFSNKIDIFKIDLVDKTIITKQDCDDFWGNKQKILTTLKRKKRNFEDVFVIELDMQKAIRWKYRCETFDRQDDFCNQIESITPNVFVKTPQLFYVCSPAEQYMIQTDVKLLKGVEKYDDQKIMVFDIETRALPEFKNHAKAALDHTKSECFQIGIRFNNGQQKILDLTIPETDELRELKHKNPQEYENVMDKLIRKKELDNITEFFLIWAEESPDLIIGHNIFGFDLPYMVGRLENLEDLEMGRDGKPRVDKYLQDIFYTTMVSKYEILSYIHPSKFFSWRPSQYKEGSQVVEYTQFSVLGASICDTMLAIKRAKAQDKSIPNARLKDNIKYLKIAKPNRVYVDGNRIGKLSNDTEMYYLNDANGKYVRAKIDLEFVSEIPTNILEGENHYFLNDSNTLYVKQHFQGHSTDEIACSNVFNFSTFDDLGDGFKEELTRLETYVKTYNKVVFTTNFYAHLTQSNKQVFRQLMGEFKTKLEDLASFNPELNEHPYQKVTGYQIVERYLYDDLWETEQVDFRYSQATFEIAKWLPTSYQRTATMGGATVWKLVLAHWSYYAGIAIPQFDEPREISGGLVGMVSSGFHGKGVKFDFSSLYPSEFIQYVPTPKIDISDVFKPILRFALNTRLYYKGKKGEAKRNGDSLLEDLYDRKQLPLKILINSFYGMLTAPKVSQWSCMDSGHMVTCLGRQHIRHVIRYFERFGFKIVYFHTDGANFILPKEEFVYSYIGKGVNYTVEKGKQYSGLSAIIAEYNELYFPDTVMALAIDEYFESCINFSAANFVYTKLNKKGELALSYVGGTLIKKTQNKYIVDFLDKNLITLMKGDFKGFMNAYNEAVQKLYANQYVYGDICSKARITKTLEDYKRNAKSTQVFMEIMLKDGQSVDLDEFCYYVNTAPSSKKTTKDIESVNTLFSEFYVSSEKEKEDILAIIKAKNKNVIRTKIQQYVKPTTLDLFAKVGGVDEHQWGNFEQCDEIRAKAKLIKAKGLRNIKDIDNKNKWKIQIFCCQKIVNCSMIPEDRLKSKGQFNAFKYLDKFNKVVSNLMIVAPERYRETLISKQGELVDIPHDLELTNGVPLSSHKNKLKFKTDVLFDVSAQEIAKQDKKKEKQQHLEEMLMPEQIELELWHRLDMSPNYMFDGKRVYKNKKYVVLPNGDYEECENGLDSMRIIQELTKYPHI